MMARISKQFIFLKLYMEGRSIWAEQEHPKIRFEFNLCDGFEYLEPSMGKIEIEVEINITLKIDGGYVVMPIPNFKRIR